MLNETSFDFELFVCGEWSSGVYTVDKKGELRNVYGGVHWWSNVQNVISVDEMYLYTEYITIYRLNK